MKLRTFSLTLLCLAAEAFAAPPPPPIVTFEGAKVISGDALPGSNAVVQVTFKIQPGYYLHSGRPVVARAIATQMQFNASAAAKAYPELSVPGSQKTIPGTPQPVQVYEGSLSAKAAVIIAPNATFPLALAGIIGYAPVNEKTHAAGRIEQVRFNFTIPRATNAPTDTAKSPAAPKKK